MLLQTLNGFAEKVELPPDQSLIEIITQDITVQVKDVTFYLQQIDYLNIIFSNSSQVFKSKHFDRL